MFPPKYLRKEAASISANLRKRGQDTTRLDRAIELDKKRRGIIKDVESKQHIRNEESQQIGVLKQEGKHEDADELIDRMANLKEEIQSLESEQEELDEELNEILLEIPNVLQSSVPAGETEEENKIVEKSGEITAFDFQPLPHWELAEKHGLIDFEQAQKISGSRFAVQHGPGARLERALINFMLDTQCQENGYEETTTPVLVRPEVMEGTGQLPKFEEDLYKTGRDDLYLIPTAEVSLVNLYRQQIFEADQLPIKKTACTPCFRREAGAHGRDTRGLMRQHQFNKVELIQITKPENSYDAHELLLADARSVLDKLELPYRVVVLCSGDTGFAASKTYDIEVWLPSQQRYREISSCSNCEGFQARRAQIQYRPEPRAQAQYCHTLNGSGVAVGRCWLAIVENFQEKDSSITIPDALRPYMGGEKRLTLS